MILLCPDSINIEKKLIDEIDIKSKSIYRAITFCRKTSSKKLLNTFINSTNSLTELLSIKNAQMEAESQEEIELYHKNLNKTILYVANEIKQDVSFSSQPQLFQLFRLISPESHSIHPNRFRDTLVQIGSYLCPEPEDINSLMSQLFYSLNTISNPIIKAIYFHHEMIRIHPFVDGNGRVARIAKNWILMYNLYPPIFIKDDIEKKEYIQTLNSSFHSLDSNSASWNDKTNEFFIQELNRLSNSLNYILNNLKS